MISPVDVQKGSIFEDSWRSRYRTAALIWAAALLIGSLQSKRPAHIHFGTPHHIIHFLGFGALAFLATAGFGNPIRPALWPPAASLCLGFAIELLQHWQNGFPIEWYDVRDDGIGIFVFTVLCHTVSRDSNSSQLTSTK